jgi:arsenite methyltransferase
MSDKTNEDKIKEAVTQTYGNIARRFNEDPALKIIQTPAQSSCCAPAQDSSGESDCCGDTAAARFYSEQELAGLPDSVTEASLGCGNPLVVADLQPGEVVLDLGSGGGIDCFMSARQVGPDGRVIGLDMTPDMIKLARRNAKKMGVSNVDFRFGEMEDIPLPDASVDVIISNCVVNLAPDKEAVFREAYRVLQPGGRISISDIVIDGDLPPSVRVRLDAWAGCIAGALDESDYLSKIAGAGFQQVEVVARSHTDLSDANDVEAAVALLGDTQEADQALLSDAGLSVGDLAHKIKSITVKAVKPR